ncbi:MAG: Do family serine endopeptidase [Alphaproteobacteria bacterium]|nr:Do family serine endopeptidase [Alphaproteobacteria bacterium]MDE2630789.1 Do family serine endopeptidase [Alphaproteobacteria bacterium]
MAAAGILAVGLAVYAFVPALTPAAAMSASSPSPMSAGKVPHAMSEVQLTFAPVVKRVAPAVVNVYSRSVVQAPAMNPFFNDPFFQQFFGSPQMRQRVQQSLGSGVVVRADGLILTNNHVIQGGQDVVVALADKREFKAKVALADPRTDLAVLKIDTHGERLPTIEFGDSDRLQVGDLVLAIGDPFGVGQTVTMGIVSALARTEVSASNYQFFIQTDAAINPGNSGGALVTTDGKLAGINTAIYSRTGESIGIGFAIPANLARRVVEGATSGGIKLPWIGADGQAVTGDIAESLHLSRPQGVLLKDIFPDGPAARAGLKTGDIVLSLDGVAVSDMQSLNYRVATRKPGDVVRAQISSHGRTRDVAVKLALPPGNATRDTATIGGRNPLTGARVENLSPAVAVDLQLDLMAKGVVVRAVSANTPSAGYGFQPGDIVRTVNGQTITSVGQLKHLLDSAGGHWDMVIDRGGQRISLRVDG